MKIAVYCIVRDRLDYTRRSLKALRKMAGCEFDLFVADNGSKHATIEYLKEQKSLGHIHYLKLWGENVGQNIAANDLIDKIVEEEYDWVLRWDNDAMPRSRRFLRKLVRRTQKMLDSGIICVTSPKISKLKFPPPAQDIGNDFGFEFELVEILGGICRLHPAPLFHRWREYDEPFRFSRFAPLGFGEASEMAKFCAECGVVMIRITDLEVEHMDGHDGQAEKMPDEHTWERREVGRYVSYGL